MGDGTRLAIAIAVLFLAMVAFFFAFHPNGVAGANNPGDALSWLEAQFESTANPQSEPLATRLPQQNQQSANEASTGGT